jgi:hypothetical protein
MRSEPWWDERITSGLASYWIYQHLGNLSPAELAADATYREVRKAADGTGALRAAVRRADREPGAWRWSYRRDLGRTRLVTIDSRCGRVLDGGRRSMLADDEWRWLDEQMTGGGDHLLLATTLPFALPHAAHHLEAWNEAVCGGVWGRLAARAGERLRRAIDLEHWAAFHTSFNRLGELIAAVAAGRRGPAPATIVLLSGDVHYAYLAELELPGRPDGGSAAFQAVCSPFRNELAGWLRTANRLAFTPPLRRLTRLLARLARVGPDVLGWRVLRGPYFDNQVGRVELEGRAARVRIERAVPGDAAGSTPRLEPVLARELARGD